MGKVTEEMGVHKQWKEQARSVATVEELAAFIKHLTEDFEHDYGTIVHAMAAGMSATFSVMDKSKQGGITGFQASCLGWEMVHRFMGEMKGGARILKFGDLLYPQYASKFLTLSPSVASWLKEEAQRRLDENAEAHPDVIEHWKRLASGVIPFGLKVEED